MTRTPFEFGDLYVMQAWCGLIKIGRSTAPERRRKQLVNLVGQKMELVLVLPGQGHDEDRILKGLRRPIVPEWFYANDVKDPLRKVLPVKISKWPFREKWQKSYELAEKLQALAYRKHLASLRKKVIAEIRSGHVYKCCAALGPNGRVREAISHEYCMLFVRGSLVIGQRYNEPVADYLGSVEAARTIGPPNWDPPPHASAEATLVDGLLALTAWEKALAEED